MKYCNWKKKLSFICVIITTINRKHTYSQSLSNVNNVEYIEETFKIGKFKPIKVKKMNKIENSISHKKEKKLI